MVPDPAIPMDRAPDGANTVDRATTRVAPTVGAVVGAFKSITTVLYARGVKQLNWPGFRRQLWQRNYHEHIIRSEESLSQIREYIDNNPMQWTLDRENPHRIALEQAAQ